MAARPVVFGGLVPMLRTPDLPGSLAFYRDVLGFTVVSRSGQPAWAALQRDGIELMLSALNRHEGDREPAFTGSLYFRVDDVDRLWEALKDRARPCYPPESFDYGMREFGVYDNNGYLLQFGSPSGADRG